MQDIKGTNVDLSVYRDKIVLIVNVASKCGFTPQYKGLEELYTKYKDKGFVILGFPANNFMGQEPGSNEEIQSFCSLTYGVTFPMFSKIDVKGKNKHPLYGYLTDKKTNPKFGGDITWNFNKFLIGKNGEILNRYDSAVKPDDPKLVGDIEKALGD
jgi:glutathione peroxidase